MIEGVLVELLKGSREPNGDLKPDVKMRVALRIQLEATAEEYGWQCGKDKFVWNEGNISPPVVTARGFLGKGAVAEVDEVVCPGSGWTMARKRIILPRRKLEADRLRQRI
jgi:hypothetical protein